MKLAYRNLIRHYRKNIHSAAIGIVTIVLLLLYAVNLDSTERQLASLPEAMEVTASVRNLNGSKDEEICISEERVDGIAACPEVVHMAPTPPSRSAIFSSTAITVGLQNLE